MIIMKGVLYMTRKQAHPSQHILGTYRSIKILSGIIYLLFVLMIWVIPSEYILDQLIIFGVFSVIKGILEIYNRSRLKKYTPHRAYAPIIIGILDIVIGIIFLIKHQLSLDEVAMLLGAWFIADSIISLFTLDVAKRINTSYYWSAMIIYLLNSLIGLVLLLAPDDSRLSVVLWVSLYFLFNGISKLFGGLIKPKFLKRLSKKPLKKQQSKRKYTSSKSHLSSSKPKHITKKNTSKNKCRPKSKPKPKHIS